MIKVGTLFAGRYGVIQKIGTGGMAEVFKAQDVVENRIVALKVMKDSLASDEAAVRRFEAEGKQAAELRHENVVSVYDVGVSAGTHYIVMEYVSGIVLKEYIRKKGKLSDRETMAISAQIACGLRAAHAHHIVHRDIKPQNIILSKDGKVKITDFGIARSIGEESKNGKFTVGSVYYISPEQAKGESCDERSDIYSLGIVMYEMITGVVPFDKETTNAVALAHMNESMKAPSEINPDCPRALEQIIFRCTQKSSARRYTNCTELLQDLKIAVSSPDYDFEQKEKAALLKNKTMVFAKNGAAAASSSEAGASHSKTSSSYGSSSRNGSAHEEADEEDDEKGMVAGLRSGRSQSQKGGFDRFLSVAGVILGILMIFLIIYIIMSLSGCLQKKNPGPGQQTTHNGDPTTATDEHIDLTTKAADDFDPATDARVPNVVGLPVMDAVKALQDAGLQYKLSQRPEYSDKYELGTIVKQSYPEGTVVAKNSTIVIVMSAGSDKFFIDPKYVGGPLSEFQKDTGKLADAIDFEYVRVTHDTIPANVIISIDPVNVTVAQGDKVVVTYSGGPNYATVPELRGKTLDQAMKALEEAGLALGEVSQDYSDEYAKDLVAAQQHPSGNRLKNGTKVNVTVSLGPKKAMIPSDLLINQDGTRNSYGAVKQRLESLGYVVVRKEVYDAEHGAHSSDESAYVISVTPAPGSEYAYGNEVTVVTATDSRILPDFSGKNYKEVAEMLSKDPYGFAVEPIYVAAKNSGQEGLVETQNPKAGSEWEKGMYITLTVYTMGMIDMKGMKAEEARSFIEEKGWVYKEVTGEYIDDATAGTVLSTDPKGGTFPEAGATITVTVAASKEEPVTEPPTDPPTEPPTDTPTDPPTDTPTEPPTESSSETPTDPPTETEPVTETEPPGSDPGSP